MSAFLLINLQQSDSPNPDTATPVRPISVNVYFRQCVSQWANGQRRLPRCRSDADCRNRQRKCCFVWPKRFFEGLAINENVGDEERNVRRRRRKRRLQRKGQQQRGWQRQRQRKQQRRRVITRWRQPTTAQLKNWICRKSCVRERGWDFQFDFTV